MRGDPHACFGPPDRTQLCIGRNARCARHLYLGGCANLRREIDRRAQPFCSSLLRSPRDTEASSHKLPARADVTSSNVA